MERNGRINLRIVAAALVILVACSAPFAGLALSEVEGNPDLSLYATNNRVEPGSEVQLQVMVQNSGQIDQGANVSEGTNPQDEQTVMTARGVTLRAREGDAPIEVKSDAVPAGNVPPGLAGPFTLEIRVDDGAEPGRYQIPVRVTYDHTYQIDARGRGHRIRTEEETLNLSITVEPDARFRISDLTSDLRVGEKGTIEGTITNIGSERAKDAVLLIGGAGPNTTSISPVETEYALGFLEENESANFSFEVDVSTEAGAGPRQFRFVTRYQNTDDQTRQSRPLEFRIPVGPEQDAFELEPIDATIEAGATGPVTLNVTNVAGERLTDVSAKLFANDPLSAEDDEAFVSELAPGETTQIVFQVSVAGGTLPKTYPLSIDFEYTNERGDTLLSDTYTVPLEVAESEGGGLPFLLAGGLVAVLLVTFATIGRR